MFPNARTVRIVRKFESYRAVIWGLSVHIVHLASLIMDMLRKKGAT